MASIGILWVEGSCQLLSWWCFLTCCPCWFIGSQKNSNRLVIREENALIWVDEKLLGFWDFHRGFLTLMVCFPFGVHLWRWCVTHQSFRIPYLHNSCRELQFEGCTNDTCTQINKYNEFIYLYICVVETRHLCMHTSSFTAGFPVADEVWHVIFPCFFFSLALSLSITVTFSLP